MEFGTYVHVELQKHCARCHDADTYKGDFRLVHARNRRDLQNDLLVRTNLDATLRLINPLDLAHSELLTVSALTHPPDGRPILGGPNHPTYRVFQTWVANLNDRGESTLAATPARGASSKKPAGEGPAFGAGRFRQTSGAAPAATTGGDFYTPPVASPRLNTMDPSFSQVAPGVPEAVDFPTPVSPGNFVPDQLRPTGAAMPAQAAPSGNAGRAAMPTGAPPKNGEVVVLDDGSKAIYLNGQYIPYLAVEDRDKAKVHPAAPEPVEPGLPPTPVPAPAAAPAAPAQAPAQPTKRRPKLDPAVLQKFMSGGQGR